jgi:phosphatase NudJ
MGDAWVTLDELADYPLRGDEVREMFAFVAAGGAVHPLSVLQPEGQAFRTDGEPRPAGRSG